MRNYRRKTGGHHAASKQDFWLSFSDLMSVLVLVFILVLFYVLYKYHVIYGAYQTELANMLVIENALSDKEDELTTAQTELTEKEDELAKQQLLLSLAQEALAISEEDLANKQQELDDALSLLTLREESAAELEAKLADQQTQLEALVGVRTNIIRTLSNTLKASDISAAVDPESGAIILESDVLFEVGSDTLSSRGKAYIDKFLPVYLSVLFSDEYNGYISEIIIEGHTDTTDTYIKNLKLSQGRAYAVAEYVLGDSSKAATRAQKQLLMERLTANGRSFSNPIYDENGDVDADASRRVVFKFRLTDEQMIAQMQAILESETNSPDVGDERKTDDQ